MTQKDFDGLSATVDSIKARVGALEERLRGGSGDDTADDTAD